MRSFFIFLIGVALVTLDIVYHKSLKNPSKAYKIMSLALIGTVVTLTIAALLS